MTLGRGTAWLDTGTHEALWQAGTFVEAVQNRQGLMIACVEEVAVRMGYIGSAELDQLVARAGAGSYGEYLRSLARGLRGEAAGDGAPADLNAKDRAR